MIEFCNQRLHEQNEDAVQQTRISCKCNFTIMLCLGLRKQG